MRKIAVAALLTTTLMQFPVLAEQTASQQQASRYSTETTPIGDLLDNPAAREIVAKYAPRVTSSSQIDAVRSRPLKALQAYAPQDLSDEVLAIIDVALAKVPVK